MDWTGRRVTVFGLGTRGGGVGAARYLAKSGARVVVSDRGGSARLAASIAALDGLPIDFHLDGHRDEDIVDADAIVVNPAIRPDHPLVAGARRAGVQVTSEIELLLDVCPAPVIAVTGTNGKSTTATMVATMLEASGRKTWLGGNIERSLLADVEQITHGDCVVLELSSFQLYWLSEQARLPQIVAITNFAPNHLDWHGNTEHYRAAKQRLLAANGPDDLLVIDSRDAELAKWAERSPRRLVFAWQEQRLPPLAIAGEHNRRNAALAAATAECAGARIESIVSGAQRFRGLEHRLQSVGDVAGRRFVNDTQATTPEATAAALDAIEGDVWLLVGGADKGADFGQLPRSIAHRARGAACYGATGPAIAAQIESAGGTCRVANFTTLDEAFAWCWQHSAAGETILLSPASSSVDQFTDYRERATRFVELVDRLRVAAAD